MKMFNDAARRPQSLTALAVAVAMALALAACGKSGAKDEHAAEGAKHAEHAGEKKEGEHKEGEKELTLTTEEAERAGVKVQEIKAEAFGETIVVTATIEPNQDRVARVAPRIEGRVTSVPAKLGDRVAAGQTLATLDSVAVGEAHAAWMQAQAELRIAESGLQARRVADCRRDHSAQGLPARPSRTRQGRSQLRATRPTACGCWAGRHERRAAAFPPSLVTSPFAGTVIEKKATLGGLGQSERATLHDRGPRAASGFKRPCRRLRWRRCGSVPMPR